jgi:hypothetical protein
MSEKITYEGEEYGPEWKRAITWHQMSKEFLEEYRGTIETCGFGSAAHINNINRHSIFIREMALAMPEGETQL